MTATFRTRLTREESQAQTRERLLVAARAEVVRKGFGGASVRDIAEAAGYSQGAFYSNFPGKEAILLELMRQHMREEAEQLRGVLPTADETLETALNALEAWAASLNTDADWSMLAVELQLHAHRSSAFAQEYALVRDAHRAELGVIVGEFFSLIGRKPPLDSGELATGFMALAHGLALQRQRDDEAPAGRLIMTFLRALVSSADQA